MTCYKEISQTDLEEWCKTKSEVLKKYSGFKVEPFGSGKFNHSFRITCDNWPSSAGAFHDGANWPTGIDVVQWTGPIRALTPNNALLLYIGKIDAESTEINIKETLKSLYKEKKVEIEAVRQEKLDRIIYILNYIYIENLLKSLDFGYELSKIM